MEENFAANETQVRHDDKQLGQKPSVNFTNQMTNNDDDLVKAYSRANSERYDITDLQSDPKSKKTKKIPSPSISLNPKKNRRKDIELELGIHTNVDLNEAIVKIGLADTKNSKICGRSKLGFCFNVIFWLCILVYLVFAGWMWRNRLKKSQNGMFWLTGLMLWIICPFVLIITGFLSCMLTGSAKKDSSDDTSSKIENVAIEN